MSSAFNNVYDLAYVVNSTLADLNESDGRAFMRHLKWANDAFRRLNLADGLPTMKTVTLEVNQDTNTVVLPSDFLELYKIGVCRNGVLINFDINDALCLESADAESVCSCDSEAIASDITTCCSNYLGGAVDGLATWYYPYYSRYHNGQFVAGIYGVGAGYKGGGYKLNLEAWKIQFDSCVQVDEVVLEYKSSGMSDDGNAIIQQTAIPAITAYIHWRRCLFSRDAMVKRQAETFRSQWVAESAAMFKRKNSLSYNDWLSLFRAFTYQIPKR